MNEMPELIDVHHHIIPKEYTKSLSKIGVTTSIGLQIPEWNVNKTLDIMDKNGISTAVVSISAPGVYFKNIDHPVEFATDLARRTNEICAELIGEHPERFGAFATLPLPDVDAALEELKYALDVLKLDGVALLSNYDGYYLGDPRFDKLFFELNRRKAVVFIHPCTPPGIEESHFVFPEGMIDVCFDTTRTAYSLILQGIMRKYPNVRFILAHAGGAVPYMAARMCTMLSIPENLGPYLKMIKENMPEGLEYYLKKFYYDTAVSASPYAFGSLQKLVDTSKIVFGSDYVFATQAAVPLTIKGVREYTGFNAKDIMAIGKENAMGLFPRLKKD